MAWKPNRKLVAEGFRDLEHVPRERAGWDATLSCLAYGMRMDIERGTPDLNEWAARHGVPASGRYEELGRNALVLWHGTSRERVERIAVHGLFHKKGLWTERHPGVPHSFCRSRSERFGTEGAVACLVLDSSELVEGRDFEADVKDNVVRFQHGLPPEVVEYVLVHEEIRFTGQGRARRPAPWPGARFRKREGRWAPVRKSPVAYSKEHSETAAYSTPREFACISIERLLEDLGEVTPLEIFSTVYAAVDPRDAITHREIIEIMEEKRVPSRRRGKWQSFRAAASEKGRDE